MRPVRIEFSQVRGGTEVAAIVRSDRGTLVRSGSIVVLRGEASPAEYKAARKAAIETLMATPSKS